MIDEAGSLANLTDEQKLHVCSLTSSPTVDAAKLERDLMTIEEGSSPQAGCDEEDDLAVSVCFHVLFPH